MAGLAEMLQHLRVERSGLLRELTRNAPATAAHLHARIQEIDAIIAAIEGVVEDR